ncbi:TPA: IS21 family transposase [Legionella pneumophila]|nr:IS21 family transposase [Legionella pneumophila]HAU1562897.1 IS21 family transposase [Legionella pneumophila]HAU1860348.1 IS21 family transposase [Legionella pneumophila]
MPAQGISMNKIREILRLHFDSKLSQHQIAASLKISSGVVNKYVSLAKVASLHWPVDPQLDDKSLRALLRPYKESIKQSPYVEPDYSSIHQELKRKGMTLLLVWQEYEEVYGKKAYRYSRFCSKYKDWLGRQKPSMRQTHRAGEKLFIDYCGPTLDVIDPATGEIRTASIFVAVLGASNYTYAEATWDQKLPNWIGSHVRAFQFFGGVPALLVPDNLKSAVTKVNRYEPQLNQTYTDLACHYGVAIVPARPYRPKDKAKVENGVLVVERWILARLRHQTFVGLAELNAAISALLQELNHRAFKKLPGTRASQFEVLDKPALKPLPTKPYELAQFSKARVHVDYHIEVDGHYYSVPYTLIKQAIDVRLTLNTVECFHDGVRIASHIRSFLKGKHTTLAEHMPPSHRAYSEWSSGRFLNWALSIGPNTRDVIAHLLSHAAHPEQSYRSCFGILSLAKRYGKDRLEAASYRAIAIGSPRRHSIVSILQKGLDQQPLRPSEPSASSVLKHENIRGANHYQSKLIH